MKKSLGFFHIVMINVIAVDSIRTLPFSAEYGLSLVFLYAIAGLFFFLPSGLISAELGTGWPNTGGIYVWVREAFGKKISLIAIWLNWIYNLAWYPTIMALIAGTSAYFFNPEFAQNKFYMIVVVVGLYWIATLINCFGMKVSSVVSSIGAIIGTILPMLCIILLGFFWLFSDNPIQITFSWSHIIPSVENFDKLAYMSNILFGLLGLEMVATHAAEMKNPQRDYPRAVIFSMMIIWLTIVLSSLAIALVVPNKELSLVTGTLQAFAYLLDAFSLSFFVPVVAALIVLGGLSAVAAWIIGPTKGLFVAAQDKSLPNALLKKNRHGVPTKILLLQAAIVTVLSLCFILFPTVNKSYWFLSVITAQLAMIVYILLFASAIKLHLHKPHVKRSFRVPGGKIGMWVTSLCGICISFIAIVLGFIPPDKFSLSNTVLYELLLVFGILLLVFVPLLFFKSRNHT